MGMGLYAVCKTEREVFEEREMNLIRSYSNWRRYRNTVNELSRLNARELNDLGIMASEIPSIARQAAHR